MGQRAAHLASHDTKAIERLERIGNFEINIDPKIFCEAKELARRHGDRFGHAAFEHEPRLDTVCNVGRRWRYLRLADEIRSREPSHHDRLFVQCAERSACPLRRRGGADALDRPGLRLSRLQPQCGRCARTIRRIMDETLGSARAASCNGCARPPDHVVLLL
jgi:hypothetical protein